MIRRIGDVFTTTSQHIAHGCNARGVMGAGVAKTVRAKFPDVYEYYHKICSNSEPEELAGTDLVALNEKSGLYVHNLITQIDPGPYAQTYYILNALTDCAINAYHLNDSQPVVIAMPMIGCGIGGLEWGQVHSIVEYTESVYSVEFEVWKFE